VTNDIGRLSEAITREGERKRFRNRLMRDSKKIRESLTQSGEYRISTPQGTIVIRSDKESA
jgi:hypothetical protein